MIAAARTQRARAGDAVLIVDGQGDASVQQKGLSLPDGQLLAAGDGAIRRQGHFVAVNLPLAAQKNHAVPGRGVIIVLNVVCAAGGNEHGVPILTGGKGAGFAADAMKILVNSRGFALVKRHAAAADTNALGADGLDRAAGDGDGAAAAAAQSETGGRLGIGIDRDSAADGDLAAAAADARAPDALGGDRTAGDGDRAAVDFRRIPFGDLFHIVNHRTAADARAIGALGGDRAARDCDFAAAVGFFKIHHSA